ncbi:Tat pathway signal sequence [Pleurostoma richardsiae]|uniref:Tat pathway signal sequence n=1 Tax=Pleurostoma richardsiae TaxID=41990 RepID=A0AA38RNA2_9PEZI|nr:Tat pathway signal sequence [Pleurostoma richardsiae]
MARVYHSVPLDEENSSLDGTQEKQTRTLELGGESFSGRIQQATRHWVWLIHAVLLSLSMTLFTLSFCERTARPSDLTVTRQFSSYSPVAPVVEYNTVRYNLTPLVEGPFVGFGPKVDEAWDSISEMGDQMISEEELDRLGLPRNSLKIKHPKTGVEGYRAAVEVFHQLHCLNLLRMRIHKDYYINIYSDIQEEEEGLQAHVDHCIETLRINLMCTSDIGIFTFREYPEYGYEEGDFWPDFSTLHTCRNFDGIHKWAVDNVVSWEHEA